MDNEKMHLASVGRNYKILCVISSVQSILIFMLGMKQRQLFQILNEYTTLFKLFVENGDVICDNLDKIYERLDLIWTGLEEIIAGLEQLIVILNHSVL